MSTSIKMIKSQLTDDTIYPITKANAVYLANSTAETVDGHLTILEDKVGTATLSTTAQNLCGAVNELNGKIGTTNISGIGNGTVTGAISTLNGNLNTSTIDSADSTSKTIAAGSTDWFSANKDSSWKGSTLVGYYVSGTGNTSINVYAFYQTSSGASAAVRNISSSSATITITFYFRHY